MKVSYEENLANYFGLQGRGGLHTEIVLSVRAKGNAGQPLSSRPKHMNRAPLSCADPVLTGRRQHRSDRNWRDRCGHGGVPEPVHAWTFQTREPGDPVGFRFHCVAIAPENGTVRKRLGRKV